MKWSSVSWPSSLLEVFKLSQYMTKPKTKLTFDAFRATQSMLPPILAPRIAQMDEGSPTQKPDEIPEEPLIVPPSALFISESCRQIISSISEKGDKFKDKVKKIDTSSDNQMNSFRNFEGQSQEQIDQDLEESLQIQALKDNPNPMLEI
ncbi:unnamed protein product [Lactuca virosa]|uniref:Uncharacterized protein n=1 Tax=Lactuca virosa TaxID=75947 RepID=A0AAU9MGQ9_9ASTR|nr:unnamed protein product [Lactuca virosa]